MNTFLFENEEEKNKDNEKPKELNMSSFFNAIKNL